MPQLDTASYLPQLFWLAVTFGVLYVIMARVALPRIGEVLRNRRERVETDLQRAEALKTEAEAALAAYQESLAGARAEAHKLTAEAVQAVVAAAEQRNAAMTARLAEEAGKAEARIAAARDAALSDLKTVAGDVAGAAIAKLIGVDADPALVSTAVDEVAAGHSVTG